MLVRRCTCALSQIASRQASTSSTASPRPRSFPRIPSPRPPYDTVESLLKASPRTASLVDKFDSWESLFDSSAKTDGAALGQSLGLGVRERRYLLWYLEKFRQGYDPKEYDVKLKGKKKVRGWGPKIQNGKRVR